MNKVFFLSGLLALVLAGLLVMERTAASDEFRAELKGADEVPPVDSVATGRVELKVAGDESMITFEMEVSRVTDMTQSHIHLAPVGSNGPIVA